MTLSTTVGIQHTASKSGSALFNNLGIYRFCIAFVIVDYLDLMDVLDSTGAIFLKYFYAAIVLGFMIAYFLRWKRIDTTALAPIIYLFFFLITGLGFAVNFFIYDTRESYISAFIAPLVFSLAAFIPPNSLILDASKITRTLTVLFSVGSVLYLAEAIIKPLDLVSNLTYLHEVQIHKSIICVLALCLSILTGRGILTIFLAVVTAAALLMRPVSTLVLALACCLPIAFALRPRVSYPRPVPVLISRAIAMTALFVAITIPLLLYFDFDDVSSAIDFGERYLKSDVIGGQSNMQFRLAILRYAFAQFDNTSFWYGSALNGNHTISLALLPGWDWWWNVQSSGEATIHSDFVVVLLLTGIVGYTIFSIAFYLVLRDRFRQLARRDLRGGAVVLQAASVIGAVALIIYCSDQPWLSYYDHATAVWLLLLISEVARKSRVI